MLSLFSRLVDGLSEWWCVKMHPEPMRPVNHIYRCPKCLRVFPVPWDPPRTKPAEKVAAFVGPTDAPELDMLEALETLETVEGGV